MTIELIRHEAQLLYKQTNGDLEGVAHFVNKVHGVTYSENDVLRIIQGKQPRKKYERSVAPEVLLQSKAKNEESIGWQRPITSLQGKRDPLAYACLQYGLKHGGVMAYDVQSCKIAMGRMK